MEPIRKIGTMHWRAEGRSDGYGPVLFIDRDTQAGIDVEYEGQIWSGTLIKEGGSGALVGRLRPALGSLSKSTVSIRLMAEPFRLSGTWKENDDETYQCWADLEAEGENAED
ncbi:hypothetical protein [Candidatus Binatus soli]|jgi:hypothetical protein|uniref:hypothetical protein n=1 Tax=Candidatus Binatus soli TaxID=1953413 RepID=UPI003D12DC62